MKKFLFAAILTLTCCSAFAAPKYVYLTWQGDTSTTMTVNFQTEGEEASEVRYGPVDGELDQTATGRAHQIRGLADGRWIHAVELTGLEPGAVYAFQVSGETYRLRTLPNDGRPIRGIFGGDLGIFPIQKNLLEQAAKQNPDVAVLGGDLAYANGDLSKIGIWDIWLERWQSIMVREDGILVPMILAIGNHEVNKSDSADMHVRAPFYLGFFAQGGQPYFARDLGPHVALIVLDTGHLLKHEVQVDFLRASLEAAEERPFILATYHVPFYPSHRSYDDSRSVAGRELWQPLFDEFDVSIGFEHHDHTFKRTKRIRAGEVDETGTLYLGDGSMGVVSRPVENAGAWYLEKAESRSHFWVVDITAESVRCRALDQLGQAFDEVSVAPRLAPAAAR